MNQQKLDAIRLNILDAPSNIVPSVRHDLLELADYTDALRKTAEKAYPQLAWQLVTDLCQGIRNAPDEGEAGVVYNEQLHLLQWFEVLDAIAPPVPLADPSLTPMKD